MTSPSKQTKVRHHSHLVTAALICMALGLGLTLPQVAWGWTKTGDLNQGRIYHTATLLKDGKVLVTGGSGPTGVPIGTAELYDPSTGKWASTGGLGWWRSGHTATLLKNGWVLVAGGYDTWNTRLYISELYIPTNKGFVRTVGDMKVGRAGHKAELLDDGRVLVMGGCGDPNSCEVFDPGSGTWTLAGSQHSSHSGFTAHRLLNGKVLTVGGFNVKSCELFTPATAPATGTWANTGDLNVSHAADFAAASMLDGRVLAAGGFNSTTGWLKTAEIFDPAGNSGAGAWTFTNSMQQARIYHTAICLKNGWVLVSGGLGQIPNAPAAVLTSAELFNPSLGVWAGTTPLITPRQFHTTTLLANGKVLAVGGDNGSGVGMKITELYVPPGSVGWPSVNMLLLDDLLGPE